MANHALTVINNFDLKERISFSLVHSRGRVDVPVRSVLRVEVFEDIMFVDTQGASWTIPGCGIGINVACDVGMRIFKLTQFIVDEPLGIFVGEDCILKPVVREPIGRYGNFNISACDLDEAQALAARIQYGIARAELRIV